MLSLRTVLQPLRDVVAAPTTHAQLFRHLGIECPRGVLMYGPPGCGKTTAVKASMKWLGYFEHLWIAALDA